jgi:two-component system, chemotaxis family, protein-glutamate methylesterase/glutaminase
MKFDAVVIGTSAGGLSALTTILSALPEHYPVPVIIVQHRSKAEPTLLEEVLSFKCRIPIYQADEKQEILPGRVYFAPGDYHLLIEQDRTFSLSFDPPVNYSRPSIDVLFESAAMVYQKKLLAIILTGANSDGADGIRMIRKMGGMTVAQKPLTAAHGTMPQAAVNTGCIQHILELDGITKLLLQLDKRKEG